MPLVSKPVCFGNIELRHNEIYATKDICKKCPHVQKCDEAIITKTKANKMLHDQVNHPSHYCDGGIETIDYIEAKLSSEQQHGYFIGNILKYISRAGKKDSATMLVDLEKAQWYLNRLVSNLKKGGQQ